MEEEKAAAATGTTAEAGASESQVLEGESAGEHVPNSQVEDPVEITENRI